MTPFFKLILNVVVIYIWYGYIYTTHLNYLLNDIVICFRDNTRPGHILGDPDRRNNPDALDTKNMSLSPFTLVRLVTHLAMFLGASEKSQVSR